MKKEILLQHPIQKHIIEVLTRHETAHFSGLRPPRVDTNLFSYHLKLLIQKGFIAKRDKFYTLDDEGLIYVDQAAYTPDQSRHLPKIITMLLIQNSDGQILLQKRSVQPYIGAWTMPQGNVRIDDMSVEKSAKRITFEELDLHYVNPRHVGDCYVRVFTENTLLSTTFVHVFRYEIDKEFSGDSFMWVEPIKLHTYHLAPVVEQIIARSFFGDEYFFDEFEYQWLVSTRP